MLKSVTWRTTEAAEIRNNTRNDGHFAVDDDLVSNSTAVGPPACYQSEMPKTIQHWLLFEYVGLEFTPLSKPFKTKEQAEKARAKYPERLRKRIGVGVIARMPLFLPSCDGQNVPPYLLHGLHLAPHPGAAGLFRHHSRKNDLYDFVFQGLALAREHSIPFGALGMGS